MTASPRGAARWYFTVMGGIGALFILVGFWPTYYGPLLTGDVTVHSPFYHVHGLVSIGWMGWPLGPWSLEMLYSPMLLAVAAYDLWTERKVHPATWVGLALLVPRVALEASYKIF